jgi:hypothetical protein
VNPDLIEEREKCAFDVDEVYNALRENEDILKYYPIAKDLRDYTELKFTQEWYDMSRVE